MVSAIAGVGLAPRNAYQVGSHSYRQRKRIGREVCFRAPGIVACNRLVQSEAELQVAFTFKVREALRRVPPAAHPICHWNFIHRLLYPVVQLDSPRTAVGQRPCKATLAADSWPHELNDPGRLRGKDVPNSIVPRADGCQGRAQGEEGWSHARVNDVPCTGREEYAALQTSFRAGRERPVAYHG